MSSEQIIVEEPEPGNPKTAGIAVSAGVDVPDGGVVISHVWPDDGIGDSVYIGEDALAVARALIEIEERRRGGDA